MVLGHNGCLLIVNMIPLIKGRMLTRIGHYKQNPLNIIQLNEGCCSTKGTKLPKDRMQSGHLSEMLYPLQTLNFTRALKNINYATV